MHEPIDEEVGAIPLAGLYRIFARNERVPGFEPHPSGTNQRWSSVFLAESGVPARRARTGGVPWR